MKGLGPAGAARPAPGPSSPGRPGLQIFAQGAAVQPRLPTRGRSPRRPRPRPRRRRLPAPRGASRFPAVGARPPRSLLTQTPAPRESPPPTARIHLPRAPHDPPPPRAPSCGLDLGPAPPTRPSRVSRSPPGLSPRPRTWRRVVQLAVVGPPAGAGGLSDKKRARHGGRSSRGRRVAQGSRGTLPVRPCRCAVSGDAPPTPLSTPAPGWAGPGGATPLVTSRQSRRAFAGGHAPSRCAGGWRG